MKLVQFDASDSAQIRLYGYFFEACAHEEGNYWDPDLSLVCPKSTHGFDCSRCEQGMPSIPIRLCLCRSGKQWRVYMCEPLQAECLMKDCERMGYSSEDMSTGRGPDILLHRYSAPMLVRSSSVGPSKIPDFSAELLEIARRSKWRKK